MWLLDGSPTKFQAPLKLIHPVETRWNTVYDSHMRMLKLRNFINAILVLPNSSWEAMELGCNAVRPLAIATDVAQNDSCSLLGALNLVRGVSQLKTIAYPNPFCRFPQAF